MNRYKRDELLHSALDMASIPTLDSRDRPQGAILPNALSIKWLQEALDIFHHKFPWAGTVTNANVTVENGSGDVILPDNFILDVRDALLIVQPSTGKLARTKRLPFQRWLSQDLHHQGTTSIPRIYTFMSNAAGTAKQISVTPKADRAYACVLYYYALPAVLEADDIPMFPVDHTLVEYIRIRAREWINSLPPGTAQSYAQKEIGNLQASGLANEPEIDYFEFDDTIYNKYDSEYNWNWMGGWPSG